MPTRQVVAVAVAALAAVLVAGCSPSEATLAPDEIVAAFIAESQDDARTFHMEWQGTLGMVLSAPDVSGAQEFTTTINASFDFSGHDFAGTMTTHAAAGGAPEPNTWTTTYARVGGAMFVRYPESGWQRTDATGQQLTDFDPLAGMTVADVAYDAPDTVDEQALHRLRILDPTAVLARTLFSNSAGSTELTSDSAEFLLYVSGRGVPLRAHLLFDGRISSGLPGEDPDLGTRYHLAFDYQFSAWDEELVIRPPM